MVSACSVSPPGRWRATTLTTEIAAAALLLELALVRHHTVRGDDTAAQGDIARLEELTRGDYTLLASRAWHNLERAAQEERANLSSNAAIPVHDAQAALSTLVPLMGGVLHTAGRPDPVLWAPDPSTEPDAVYERIEQARTVAWPREGD
ncbi:hypothetical protein OH736_02070 [Streptomyces sp. NBC_01650]|uniref:hypothetical protein n=1 Tax=Streptomyces sp. NBC_01650 TaxID=2975907 RepID=UPI003864D2DA|nr:hypothetical protein OH736_02070 [Streptomyces sp. NBC_01650]